MVPAQAKISMQQQSCHTIRRQIKYYLQYRCYMVFTQL